MGHYTITYEVWEDDESLTEITRTCNTYEEAMSFIETLLRELITFKTSHVAK